MKHKWLGPFSTQAKREIIAFLVKNGKIGHKIKPYRTIMRAWQTREREIFLHHRIIYKDQNDYYCLDKLALQKNLIVDFLIYLGDRFNSAFKSHSFHSQYNTLYGELFKSKQENERNALNAKDKSNSKLFNRKFRTIKEALEYQLVIRFLEDRIGISPCVIAYNKKMLKKRQSCYSAYLLPLLTKKTQKSSKPLLGMNEESRLYKITKKIFIKKIVKWKRRDQLMALLNKKDIINVSKFMPFFAFNPDDLENMDDFFERMVDNAHFFVDVLSNKNAPSSDMPFIQPDFKRNLANYTGYYSLFLSKIIIELETENCLAEFGI